MYTPSAFAQILKISENGAIDVEYLLVTPMPYAPDYGLMFSRSGIQPGTDFNFYGLPISNIEVLGINQFSVCVLKHHDGSYYAISIDFNLEHLDSFLSCASKNTALSLYRCLYDDPTSPRSIELEEEISISVKTILGELQRNAQESFVPFIVKDVLCGLAKP